MYVALLLQETGWCMRTPNHPSLPHPTYILTHTHLPGHHRLESSASSAHILHAVQFKRPGVPLSEEANRSCYRAAFASLQRVLPWKARLNARVRAVLRR